ncbi:helix-turn-helix domain-containing protein [Streptomyces sp. NPDC052101]|uniref:helix-turn-helix domain-containing protein n=1 Tax=Streptomyces sp. NPDC052101 TaxID=3155763 RepID=UPI0034391827
MQRAARKGGTRSLLRWLAGRTGVQILLADTDGNVVPPSPQAFDRTAAELMRRGVRELSSRSLHSMAIDGERHAVLLFPLDGPRAVGAPVLTAVTARPAPVGLFTLLADASLALSLCWQSEHTEREWRLLERAEARNREAVLHLLMNGHLSAARQVAGVLLPPLPSAIRFYVVECPPRVRGELAGRCAHVAASAWIVPCPVYADHLLVLAPAAAPSLQTTLTALADGCTVGVSETVPLCDTAVGYAQAFHALAVARNGPNRYAEFARRPDLALTIGPAAAAWANRVLAPLRTYSTRRSQDPGSGELAATAASWLAFSSQATAHLKIHRNTLSARLKHIEELLHLNLGRLADQSLLAFALRAGALPDFAYPHGSTDEDASITRACSLDDLLARPAVVAWARQQLHPIRSHTSADDLSHTLATWLDNDGRLAPTAIALSLSTTATRKRLTRIETLLERSLIGSPNARHDLWLAQRALTLADRQC